MGSVYCVVFTWEELASLRKQKGDVFKASTVCILGRHHYISKESVPIHSELPFTTIWSLISFLICADKSLQMTGKKHPETSM